MLFLTPNQWCQSTERTNHANISTQKENPTEKDRELSYHDVAPLIEFDWQVTM